MPKAFVLAGVKFIWFGRQIPGGWYGRRPGRPGRPRCARTTRPHTGKIEQAANPKIT
jgi:hypothetical protein